MIERNYYLNPPVTGEGRIIYVFLGISLLLHLFVFVVDKSIFMSQSKPLYEEWAIEAEIVSDINVATPTKSSLPNARESEDAKVSDRVLPQLPKKFVIEKEVKDKEVISEQGIEQKEKPAADEEVKTSDKDVNLKSDTEDNKIRMQDAIRRLAIERLREQNKLAEQNEAEKSERIAKLRKEMASAKDINTSGSEALRLGSSAKVYRARLRTHVGRFWSVPEAYNLKEADLLVTISIVVNERGYLVNSEVKKPSGDEVFDQLAFNAVKEAMPLPKPPKDHVGKEILLNFTPKSF